MTSIFQKPEDLQRCLQRWQFRVPQLGEISVTAETVAGELALCLDAKDRQLSLVLSGGQEQCLEGLHCSGFANTSSIRLGLLQLLDFGFALQPQLKRIKLPEFAADNLPSSIQWQSSLNRITFYQCAELYLGQSGQSYPLAQRLIETGGVQHPRRPLQPEGEFYRRYVMSINKSLSFRTIDPETDLELFHRWMNHPAIAPIWELGKPKAELKDYLLQRQQDPHMFSAIGCFDDDSFGYFELYWTLEDRLGPHYDALPYDRGLHLLVGNRRYLGDKYFDAWMNGLCHFLFLEDPRTQYVYGEPRADNVRLKRHVMRFNCWSHLKDFDFPHKRASLLQCDRNPFFEGANLR